MHPQVDLDPGLIESEEALHDLVSDLGDITGQARRVGPHRPVKPAHAGLFRRFVGLRLFGG